MEEVNHVEANAAQINGTATHEDNPANGAHEEKKLVSSLEKSEKSTAEGTPTKTEAPPPLVQKPKLSNVELANLSKDLDKLSKYNLKDIVVQILKSFPETETSVREHVKVILASRASRQTTPRKSSISTPRTTNNNNTQSSPSRPSTSRSTSSSNPNLFSAGPTAKRVTVFLAGQELKNGQVILINQGRTFEQFVDDVMNKFKFINNNIKIYSYPATNLIQSVEELESGMQLLAALPNQKPQIQTAQASPKKTASPVKSNPPPPKSNAPPSVSVAPRKSDPGPMSQRNNNNNNATPKRVYQPKTPTKQPDSKIESKPETPRSTEKKVMVRGPVQREVVTNPQKSISVKDLIGASTAKNSPPSKSGKDGWILPQKSQPAQPPQPEHHEEIPANNHASQETASAQPAEIKPVQQPAPEVRQPPAETKPEPVQQSVPIQREPSTELQEESASPTKPETPRAAVTSPEPKSDTQIAKDLDSKLLEVMNRRRMEQQQQKQS